MTNFHINSSLGLKPNLKQNSNINNKGTHITFITICIQKINSHNAFIRHMLFQIMLDTWQNNEPYIQPTVITTNNY
jgi:hypothetical protein